MDPLLRLFATNIKKLVNLMSPILLALKGMMPVQWQCSDAELNISMVHNGNIQGLPYETNDSKYIFVL